MPVVPDVADLTRRAAVVWVEVDGRSHPVWHVWHDEAMYVVSGGLEQPLPETTVAVVAVPDNGAIAVRWDAVVARVSPGSEHWDSVIPLLVAARLNPSDGAAQPERWARESMVQRFTPR